ncbi:MAG TPA: 50S ribosomal protein L3 [Nanoarchaeota archaeon]|nr:MAG: large subunit ribosomal protein L3 [archaeon GW2011_AR6]HIH18214.1 50S ribosomal protein L3 [Nanoarchaeota archaeon]HIH50914.1 50S ribosomal protein L3 [Nanoarchaeota archaeon]HIH65971.1 50S ribosomal protein L3 [Nanoarchaeota archaeon]
MPTKHRPRKGTLQFWPRKRAAKILPSANWHAVEAASAHRKEGLLGFVGYKVGMTTALVHDLTPNSLTINENVAMAMTVIECPPMKVMGIKLYRGEQVATEFLADKLDKDLKRRIKLPKQAHKIENVSLEGITDVHILCHTQPRHAKLKKTPEIFEIGIKAASVERKFELAKEMLGKEVLINSVFSPQEAIDVKGVTKGKGLVGPVKRFGLGLKGHKSEKGVRRPGSLGPWIPKKVTFRAPISGQMGFQTRMQYNNQIIHTGSKEEAEKLRFFDDYGLVRNQFLMVKGSLQGTEKRALMLCAPIRRPKHASNYKFVRLVR